MWGQNGLRSFKDFSRVSFDTLSSSINLSNKLFILIVAALYSTDSISFVTPTMVSFKRISISELDFPILIESKREKSLLTNLKLPAIPFSLQSLSLSGEARESKKNLAVSIPYFSETTSGLITLPLDLLILIPPSPRSIP